jgi:hypothetical protein
MSDEGKMRARVTVKVGVGLHALLPGLQPPVMDVHSDSSLPMLEPMLSGSSLDTAWAWGKWRWIDMVPCLKLQEDCTRIIFSKLVNANVHFNCISNSKH